jgi:hypothetical protein
VKIEAYQSIERENEEEVRKVKYAEGEDGK